MDREIIKNIPRAIQGIQTQFLPIQRDFNRVMHDPKLRAGGIPFHQRIQPHSASARHHQMHSVGRSEAFKIMIVPGEDHLHPILFGQRQQVFRYFNPILNPIQVLVIPAMQSRRVQRMMKDQKLPRFVRSCQILLQPAVLFIARLRGVLARVGHEQNRKIRIAMSERIVMGGPVVEFTGR
jgi:hypothetical protein